MGLCRGGAALTAQQTGSEVLMRIFDAAVTVEDKLALVEGAAAGKDTGAGEFFSNALETAVLAYPGCTTKAQKKAAEEMARLAAIALGDAKHEAAAPFLWKTVETFFDADAKAEALVALGKIGDAAYLPAVIKILKNVNATPSSWPAIQSRAQIIAGGAVRALEAYKDPAGYEPVFFASVGWLGVRTRKQAHDALKNISSDPTDFVINVIKSPALTGQPKGANIFGVKYQALRAEAASDAGADRKAQAALAALSEGWNAGSAEASAENKEIRSMRLLALDLIRRYGAQAGDAFAYDAKGPSLNVLGEVPKEDRDTSEELCAGLYRSYDQGDADEKKAVLRALAALGTNDAARLLGVFLERVQNARQWNTLTAKDEVLVRVIIPALGAARRKLSLEGLQIMQDDFKWPGAVRSLAANAVRQIEAGGR